LPLGPARWSYIYMVFAPYLTLLSVRNIHYIHITVIPLQLHPFIRLFRCRSSSYPNNTITPLHWAPFFERLRRCTISSILLESDEHSKTSILDSISWLTHLWSCHPWLARVDLVQVGALSFRVYLPVYTKAEVNYTVFNLICDLRVVDAPLNVHHPATKTRAKQGSMKRIS